MFFIQFNLSLVREVWMCYSLFASKISTERFNLHQYVKKRYQEQSAIVNSWIWKFDVLETYNISHEQLQKLVQYLTVALTHKYYWISDCCCNSWIYVNWCFRNITPNEPRTVTEICSIFNSRAPLWSVTYGTTDCWRNIMCQVPDQPPARWVKVMTCQGHIPLYRSMSFMSKSVRQNSQKFLCYILLFGVGFKSSLDILRYKCSFDDKKFKCMDIYKYKVMVKKTSKVLWSLDIL